MKWLNCDTGLSYRLKTSRKMTLVQEDLVKILKGKSWLFELLVEPFRRAIEHSLNLKESWTTTALTWTYYKKISLPPSIKVRQSSKLIKSSYEYWEYAIADLAPNGKVIKITELPERNYESALSLLSQTQSETFSAFDKYIDFVCPIEADFRSSSHPHYCATIFLKIDRPPNEIALSLVHELAHQELFLLNTVDRLVNSNFDFNLLHAPFQGTLRPPIGRLHSAHAMFRMIEFQKDIGQVDEHLDLLFRDTIAGFQPTELTPFGQRLINEVYII